MAAAAELAATVGAVAACHALDVARASFYRLRRGVPAAAPARPTPPRALTAAERHAVLEVLHSERFVDTAPTEVYATLLDEGTYHCAPRTMYRVLAAAQEVRERRNQLRHPPYQKPELLATRPNQVWSWDITKLLGPVKWTYFSLYVILDIFSRYVVGWMVAHQEGAALAERLISATCEKQAIVAGQLTIHADRGTSMTSKPVALLLADLGVTRTHSRPHVSDDNPYSEAQFKTLKYRPEFPERFGAIEDARAFCQQFFAWYNTEHRHGGIGLLTPESVHYGRVGPVLAQRHAVLASAYTAHPERFVRKPPEPPAVPTAAWINRPSPPSAEREKGGYPGMAAPLIVDPRGAETLAPGGEWPQPLFFTPHHALQPSGGAGDGSLQLHQHDETNTLLRGIQSKQRNGSLSATPRGSVRVTLDGHAGISRPNPAPASAEARQ